MGSLQSRGAGIAPGEDRVERGAVFYRFIPPRAQRNGIELMQSRILRNNDQAGFETEERCAIVETANIASDPTVSIARAEPPQGTA